MSSEDASLLCQPVDTAPPNPTPLSQGSAPNGVVDQTPASVSHLQPTNTAEAPRPSAAAPALEQHATSTTGNVKGTGESISSVPSLSVAGLVENKDVNKLVDVATFTETKAVGAGAVATGLTCLPCRLAKVKCDKMTPCSRCVRLGVRCHQQIRKRGRRRNTLAPIDHAGSQQAGPASLPGLRR